VLSCGGSAELRAVQKVFSDRFGVDHRVIEEWRLYTTGSVIWGLRDAPHLDTALAALRVERTGLPLLRRAGKHWKPTTVALQVLGAYLERSRIELTRAELETLLASGGLRGTRPGIEPGYVALSGPDGVVGCAIYLAPDPDGGHPDGVLLSQLPKARWEGLIRQAQQASGDSPNPAEGETIS